MFEFIYILKAIAAVLITNSHYGHIWPYSGLATGGLLGDVLFFAVSGFCLARVSQNFIKWYSKRIFRVYPPLIIMTAVGLIIGLCKISGFLDAVKLFIFPTYFHFIASIMLLYFPFYICAYLRKKLNIKWWVFMIAVLVLYAINYIFFFDMTYYHIDVVEEYTIRFLLFESMLLGAFFREKLENEEWKPKIKPIPSVIILVGLTAAYFGSKIAFSKIDAISQLQFLNQIVLFALLFFILYVCCIWERTKKKSIEESKLGKAVKWLSALTLEIYVVQYSVYHLLPKMVFPLNFAVTTILIVLFAFILNFICKRATKCLNKLIKG